MHRSSSRSVPAVAAGLILVLAACGGTTPSNDAADAPTDSPSQVASTAPSADESSEAAERSEAAAAEETVRLSQFAFEPAKLTIAAGTEVSFVNADAAPHTATEGVDGVAVDDPIIDEEMEQNGSASVTFDEPGTYEITCRFHSSMNMTIVVE